MVTNRPETLIAVSLSSKATEAAITMATSLKMPQIDSVTTLVRFRRANSETIMRKARIPGKSKMKILGKPVRTGKNGVAF